MKNEPVVGEVPKANAQVSLMADGRSAFVASFIIFSFVVVRRCEAGIDSDACDIPPICKPQALHVGIPRSQLQLASRDLNAFYPILKVKFNCCVQQSSGYRAPSI